MLDIRKNVSLKPYNTFGITARAAFFVEITTKEELVEVLTNTTIGKPFFILSGGSNMLLTNDIDAFVIRIASKGIDIEEQEDTSVLVTVQAGENWHEFVQYCIAHNFGGVENLSLIPGCVGSAPIQNIGAYGVALKDTFVHCEALHIETGVQKQFLKAACNFGYRTSIFKTTVKGEYIITSVTFRLTTKNHTLKTEYGAIAQELKDRGVVYPTISDISKSVIAIRQRKLPDPKVLGNSGSFFKNPVILITDFEVLERQYPTIPSYPIDSEYIKVPAGWLVETAGFKGKRFGDAGVHDKQALVLVNHGNATGAELLELSQKIQATILEQFGIALEAEVNIL